MIKGDEMFILLDEVGNIGIINNEKFEKTLDYKNLKKALEKLI